MKILFSPYKPRRRQNLEGYILRLYEEDPGGKNMNGEKIARTIDTLQNNPALGKIIIIEADGRMVGYALLIHYWSNEYGGFIVFIDELYISPGYRSRGIGARFIREVMSGKWAEAKACVMETLPGNKKALDLYLRLGFRVDDRKRLICEQAEG